MKVLITGAGGLLGHKLVTLLYNKPNVEVIATAKRPLPYALEEASQFIPLNVTIQQEVHNVITHSKPHVVIHAAAITQVDQCEREQEICWQTNATAVAHLINACKKINAHFILLSTDFVFDGQDSPLEETATPNPINHYGRSKLEAEEMVKKSNLKWAIVRTALVYGVGTASNHSNIVLWVKKSLEDNKTIYVVNDQWRTPTLAEDLAMGCYKVTQKGAQGVYHISGEEMFTPHELALQVAQFFRLDRSLIKQTNSIAFTQYAKRPLKTGLVIAKAKRELCYQPHTFCEGLHVVASQLSID